MHVRRTFGGKFRAFEQDTRTGDIGLRMAAGAAGPIDDDRSARGEQDVIGMEIGVANSRSIREKREGSFGGAAFFRSEIDSARQPVFELLPLRGQAGWCDVLMDLRMEVSKEARGVEQFPGLALDQLKQRAPLDAFHDHSRAPIHFHHLECLGNGTACAVQRAGDLKFNLRFVPPHTREKQFQHAAGLPGENLGSAAFADEFTSECGGRVQGGHSMITMVNMQYVWRHCRIACAKEMRNLPDMISIMPRHRMLSLWAGVSIVVMFASSSTTGAESTGTVGGRKVTLAGVLRLGTTNLVCMVPGLKNHESFPYILEEGHSFGGLEARKVSFHPAEVTFHREGETLVLKIESPESAKVNEGNVRETVGLKASEMVLRQFIEAYQQINRVTLVHPANLPNERMNFSTEGTASEVRAKMDEAFKAKGLVVTNLSERIAAVVPASANVQWPEDPEKLSRYKNLRPEIVPYGSLKLSEMPSEQFLQIYEMFSNLKIARDGTLLPVSFTMTAGSDLTRREVMHVFEALLAVNGYVVVEAGEGKVKLKPVGK